MSLSQSILLCAAVFYGLAFLVAYVVHNWAEWRYRRAKSRLGKVLSFHNLLERWKEHKKRLNETKSNYGKSRI